MAQEIDFESVIGTLAELAEKFMGVEKTRLHDGTPLVELCDSLCLLELVMLLEREFHIDIDMPSHSRLVGERIDAYDLAHAVVRQHGGRYAPVRRATFMPLPGLVPA
jgi:acyl carrier protein